MILIPRPWQTNDARLPRLMMHASLNILAVSVALLQPVFKSLAYIFIKRCNNRGIPYNVVLFYYSLTGFVTASFTILVATIILVFCGKSVTHVLQPPSAVRYILFNNLRNFIMRLFSQDFSHSHINGAGIFVLTDIWVVISNLCLDYHKWHTPKSMQISRQLQ